MSSSPGGPPSEAEVFCELAIPYFALESIRSSPDRAFLPLTPSLVFPFCSLGSLGPLW